MKLIQFHSLYFMLITNSVLTLADEGPRKYVAEDVGEEGRSIKTGLDQVLRNVRLRLENIFKSNKQPTTKTSRLIKTPIETILPESWLSDDDVDFYLGNVPRDVEIQIEDLNRRWEDGNIIPNIDRDTFFDSKKKVRSKRKKQKLKKLDEDEEKEPESKIHFTQIIRNRGKYGNGHHRNQKIHQTDILDNYSPFIYAELLKENQTNYVVVEDLTEDNDDEEQVNKTSAVLISEIDVFDETTEKVVDSELVTLEVAQEDSIKHSTESNTDDKFLPYIPPGVVDDYQEEFELDVIGDDENVNNDTYEFGDVIFFTGDEPIRVTLKSDSWAFPILIISGCFASTILIYQSSVMFSLASPLTFTSHTTLLGRITLSCCSKLKNTLLCRPFFLSKRIYKAKLFFNADSYFCL